MARYFRWNLHLRRSSVAWLKPKPIFMPSIASWDPAINIIDPFHSSTVSDVHNWSYTVNNRQRYSQFTFHIRHQSMILSIDHSHSSKVSDIHNWPFTLINSQWQHLFQQLILRLSLMLSQHSYTKDSCIWLLIPKSHSYTFRSHLYPMPHIPPFFNNQHLTSCKSLISVVVVVSTPSRAWARTGSQTPARGPPSFSPHTSSSAATPTGSVHKSQTVSVVGMSGQLKRCNESWFGSLQSGQFAAGWLAGSILCR